MVTTKQRARANPDLDRELQSALVRGARVRAAGVLGTSVSYDRDTRRVMIELQNGVLFGVPVASLPEISKAKDPDLEDVALLGAGGVLHWEALDADYSVLGLLLDAVGKAAARRELARLSGQTTSEAKAAAARANGKKGGRPRKTAVRPKRS